MVVDDANRGFESQLQGPAGDRQGILRMGNPAADNGIDIDIKFSEFRQPLELPVDTFRLFFETSSGITLSIEICRCSRPARFNRWIRSGVRRYPLVMMVAMAP